MKFAYSLIALAGLSLLSNSLTAKAMGESLLVSPKQGWLIHDATYLEQPDWWPDILEWDGTGLNDDPSYRYGASMIRYDDNKLHFWSCSEGNGALNIADYIRYRHSSNGGRTWSVDEIVLEPTIGTDDGWAVCDPNVVKIGSYYYMAYTATNDSNNFGLNNQIFVARSLQATGPFIKWDGSGWSGNSAKAIINYNGPRDRWGYGEPNMVVVGDVQDQTDIKYVPELNLFIATAIGNRFTENSYVHVWWSNDGLSFQPVNNDNITANIQATAHNIAMSGDESGHIQMGNKEFLAYSYTGPDGEWGLWNTWLNPIEISGAGWVPPSPTINTMQFGPILMLLLEEEE